jgi:copper oxidase (laccase) domain-containing protein
MPKYAVTLTISARTDEKNLSAAIAALTGVSEYEVDADVLQTYDADEMADVAFTSSKLSALIAIINEELGGLDEDIADAIDTITMT